MPSTNLPSELLTSLGSESQDFSVKANRLQPLRKSISLLAFGIYWTIFSSIFVIVYLVPIFLGEEYHSKANGVDTIASAGTVGELITPVLIIGLFLLSGFWILAWAMYSIFAEGGYFVGTPTRLVSYRNGKFKSYDWEQFTGTIEVNGNIQNGNITFTMRTGEMVSRKNGPDQYVPDTTYIAGVENVFEVERLCRQRIRENDPTPANTTNTPVI